jgi:hypothetical protein
MRAVIPFLLVLAAGPLMAQDSATTPKPFTAAENARYLELGQKYNRWFLTGQADSLLAAADSVTAEKMGGLEGIRAQMENMSERVGVVLSVVTEKMTRLGGTPQFWFEANFSEFTQEPVVFRWLMNEQGQLVGAGMNPKSAARADK